MARNLGKKRVIFNVHAPNAHEVAVAGTFNDWDPSIKPMKRDDEGNWIITFFLSAGKYEYRFVIDGIWTDDPCGTTRRRNVILRSAARNPFQTFGCPMHPPYVQPIPYLKGKTAGITEIPNNCHCDVSDPPATISISARSWVRNPAI